MKILITGSLGFIATNLIIKLSQKNKYSLVGVDSGISQSCNKIFTSKLCNHNLIDLNNKNKLCILLKDVDLVIHLAANGNVIESIENPLLNFQSNVICTLNLLECMREMNVKKLIFSSTGGALIGNCNPPVNELSFPKPISPYGASKLACEGYISSYAESFGIKSTILRFSNVYGTYSLHKKGVINKWIDCALNNTSITIYGDGQSSRDYIHVKDLCDGINLAIEYLEKKNIEKNNIFHLANNQETTLKDLFNLLSKISSKQLKVNYLPSRKGEVIRNFADIKKAKFILGFEPIISLEEGLKNLYEWIADYK